ncbi:uncharacterized protein BT62DRAFT_472303 [Guyanagaster necrorhizus]|uniref:Uncharacterized protein n=1 Tax=Guyanagaster necrorhizus TaxID=856835 RepID=A0A9P7VK03_9AGAR|nr:uncharacterized protein BT62DRAFT_472303 [Guyanagaster necrorhizus MCA 3950]KAG7441735.1 hypothetical protein BT62DRAFT_472303 [Guyanagaster necrorhizus MCA 3950]
MAPRITWYCYLSLWTHEPVTDQEHGLVVPLIQCSTGGICAYHGFIHPIGFFFLTCRVAFIKGQATDSIRLMYPGTGNSRSSRDYETSGLALQLNDLQIQLHPALAGSQILWETTFSQVMHCHTLLE